MISASVKATVQPIDHNASAPGFTRVVACVGADQQAHAVVLHAAMIARALAVPLRLLRVFETRSASGAPLDPLDWEIRRREAHAQVEALMQEHRHLHQQFESEVLEGHAAEQISFRAQSHPCELTVLGIHGSRRPSGWGLGDTTQEVIARAAGSLLLVPCQSDAITPEGYRRVLVPIDGSCRAESVLPFAIRLARTQRAELLLAHVVPQSALTEVVPPESEDLELCERLNRRNERVARLYLDQLQTRAAEAGVSASTQVLRADVRGSLARLASDESVDLVVISAQGCSGRMDVSYGSVTSYLMTHVGKPLLIMRPLGGTGPGNGGTSVGSLGLPMRGVC